MSQCYCLFIPKPDIRGKPGDRFFTGRGLAALAGLTLNSCTAHAFQKIILTNKGERHQVTLVCRYC